jgi:hypothetical protein
VDPNAPMCPYCGNRSMAATGVEVYPHRHDLAKKKFYQCKPCNAYVGCHENSGKPFGALADGATRSARNRAHGAFDPWWKSGKVRRTDAYHYLARALGIPESKCHISMMDAAMCEQVIAAMKRLRESESQ